MRQRHAPLPGPLALPQLESEPVEASCGHKSAENGAEEDDDRPPTFAEMLWGITQEKKREAEALEEARAKRRRSNSSSATPNLSLPEPSDVSVNPSGPGHSKPVSGSDPPSPTSPQEDKGPALKPLNPAPAAAPPPVSHKAPEPPGSPAKPLPPTTPPRATSSGHTPLPSPPPPPPPPSTPPRAASGGAALFKSPPAKAAQRGSPAKATPSPPPPPPPLPSELAPPPPPVLAHAGSDDLDDLDDLIGLPQEDDFPMAPPKIDPPEEAARKRFAQKVLSSELDDETLQGLINELKDTAPSWGKLRQARSAALLIFQVGRSRKTTRASFVSHGMLLLGEVLQDCVSRLVGGTLATSAEKDDATYRAIACVHCLSALPIGRATMWEHHRVLGKTFDQLVRWARNNKSDAAAELKPIAERLIRRWQKQPKSAQQEASPDHKSVRVKAMELIKEGLLGKAGPLTPASPRAGSPASGLLPVSFVASEIEAALYALYKGGTEQYRAHARMLKSNLLTLGNQPLRTRILNGELPAQELVALDSRELAPEYLREQRKAVEQEALKSVVEKAVLKPPPSNMRDATDQKSFDLRFEAHTAPMALMTEEEQEAQTPVAAAAPAPPAATMGPPATPAVQVAPATPLVLEVAPATPRGVLDFASTPAPVFMPLATPDIHVGNETPWVQEDETQTRELLRWLQQDCD